MEIKQVSFSVILWVWFSPPLSEQLRAIGSEGVHKSIFDKATPAS